MTLNSFREKTLIPSKSFRRTSGNPSLFPLPNRYHMS